MEKRLTQFYTPKPRRKRRTCNIRRNGRRTSVLQRAKHERLNTDAWRLALTHLIDGSLAQPNEGNNSSGPTGDGQEHLHPLIILRKRRVQPLPVNNQVDSGGMKNA